MYNIRHLFLLKSSKDQFAANVTGFVFISSMETSSMESRKTISLTTTMPGAQPIVEAVMTRPTEKRQHLWQSQVEHAHCMPICGLHNAPRPFQFCEWIIVLSLRTCAKFELGYHALFVITLDHATVEKTDHDVAECGREGREGQSGEKEGGRERREGQSGEKEGGREKREGQSGEKEGGRERERRFRAVNSGARHVVFIQCSSEVDPTELVHTMLSDIHATKIAKSR